MSEQRLIDSFRELLYRMFIDPCYKCKHDGHCDFIGFCGDNGMSFYSKDDLNGSA